MSMNENLSNIFIFEQREDWKEVSLQYTKLYQEKPTQAVAMHFAFFCWYLLWQWDEISFPGEKISPYERMTVDSRNGISKKDLLANLDATTQQLLSSDKIPDKYLMVLVHMKMLYPYFFKDETLSEETAKKLLVSISDRSLSDLGVKVLSNYLRNQSNTAITDAEKEAVNSLFTKGSLMQKYFTWLFS